MKILNPNQINGNSTGFRPNGVMIPAEKNINVLDEISSPLDNV